MWISLGAKRASFPSHKQLPCVVGRYCTGKHGRFRFNHILKVASSSFLCKVSFFAQYLHSMHLLLLFFKLSQHNAWFSAATFEKDIKGSGKVSGIIIGYQASESASQKCGKTGRCAKSKTGISYEWSDAMWDTVDVHQTDINVWPVRLLFTSFTGIVLLFIQQHRNVNPVNSYTSSISESLGLVIHYRVDCN